MRLRFFLITAAILLLCGGSASAQCITPAYGGTPTCMTRTTLSANAAVTDTVIQVTSATGFTVGNGLYVDFEQMRIVAISGTSITVARGQNGTRAEAHDNSDGVFTGVDNGGPRGGGHFNTQDPQFGQDCVRGQSEATHLPWINVRSGAIWTCDVDSATSEWEATRKPNITAGSELEQF